MGCARMVDLPLLAALGIIGILVVCNPLQATNPTDPKVRRMVERGMAYLDSGLEEAEEEDRLGGKCLIGLAFFKEGHPETHHRITAAVDQCLEACRPSPRNIREDIYSTGIAAIFLTELDASKYRDAVEKLLQSLYLRQKSFGGWGYPPPNQAFRTGDTSMTQYAVLALWTAQKHGIPLADRVVDRACNWLIRVQDPSGAWGYQGNDPGQNNYQRVSQSEIRPSLCAAALGSVYICSDLIGVQPARAKRAEAGDEEALPAAFRLVTNQGNPERAAGRAGTRVSPDRLRRAISDGEAWFHQPENKRADVPIWPLYYLYALERYQSFRELATGGPNREWRWYDQAVNYLARRQQKDGRWNGQEGDQVATAFAVLVLIRSTKRAIAASYGDGRLTGGRGLPKNVSNVQVREGKLISKPLGGSVRDALAVLENPDHPDYDYLAQFGETFQLSQQPDVRRRQVNRLRRLVRSGSYSARAAAVKALARGRNLDDVPYLIFALTDPDPRVRLEARVGLRFVSRRFDGVGIDSQTDDAQTRAQRIDAWKQWYLTIRPDAVFLQ